MPPLARAPPPACARTHARTVVAELMTMRYAVPGTYDVTATPAAVVTDSVACGAASEPWTGNPSATPPLGQPKV